MDKKAIEQKKQNNIENIKSKLKAYVDNGGILENLTIKDEEYIAVKNCDIYLDGKRLSIEERFSYLGYPRLPQQKPYTEKLKDIKTMLDEFVAAGGNIEQIGEFCFGNTGLGINERIGTNCCTPNLSGQQFHRINIGNFFELVNIAADFFRLTCQTRRVLRQKVVYKHLGVKAEDRRGLTRNKIFRFSRRKQVDKQHTQNKKQRDFFQFTFSFYIQFIIDQGALEFSSTPRLWQIIACFQPPAFPVRAWAAPLADAVHAAA